MVISAGRRGRVLRVERGKVEPLVEPADGFRDGDRIVVAGRPGYRTAPRKRNVPAGAEWVMIPQYDLSSTEIRERVRSNLSIRNSLSVRRKREKDSPVGGVQLPRYCKPQKY